MSQTTIRVSIANQQLELLDGDDVVFQATVSTALNGAGEMAGSECTPRGRHVIRAMIGQGCEAGTVFVARRPTGEIYSEGLQQQQPGRDWILTRILWLSGCEPGKNRFGNVDTMRRYIYIHGCPDSMKMGVADSHGCIRMRNTDVIQLFDLVTNDTEVVIEE